MTYQPQHSKTTLIAKFSVAIMLSISLIYSPSLSHAQLNEKISNDVNLGKLKTQLLEDPAFLSKLKEKIVPYINDHDIQKVVKDYLLTNPEIMIQMQFILQEKLEKLEEQRTQKQSSVINSLKKEIFQSPHDIVLGNPNGKIALVDFFDYNCKFCKSSYHHIESLIKEYPNLRVIVKDLPILGRDSTAAHTVAYAFRKQLPEKYPQFYKALLTNQGRANEATAIKIAISLGADERKLRNAIKDPTLLNSFKENIQIASALNITGTPSYIIGDKVLIGAVSKNILEELIKNMQ
ncbi:DsbA family protein [Bartonella sp. cb54]|uniref:DsbA family protein n=1 Tax=Bartonella sp. cb54 TaxID=3385560 RepID=UPI0039A48B5E